MDVFQQSPSQKIPGKNILLSKMKKYHVLNVLFVFLLCSVIFLCHLVMTMVECFYLRRRILNNLHLHYSIVNDSLMGKSPTGKIDTNAIKQHYLCIKPMNENVVVGLHLSINFSVCTQATSTPSLVVQPF